MKTRVLVFEDTPDIARLYEQILAFAGFEVKVVSNPDLVMQELVTNRDSYDVALFDWMIGTSKDASELVCQCVREELPVMVRTNRSPGQWTEEAMQKIANVVGEEKARSFVEFSPTVDVKIMGIEDDLKNFTSRHLGSSTNEVEPR